MAKANANGVTVQYKVHLKPTDVGLLVIRRLERPHADKSVELRRFIELGYAAERAGFILDGTVLRHAGRAWDVQPNLAESGLAPMDEPACPSPMPPEVDRNPKSGSQPSMNKVSQGDDQPKQSITEGKPVEERASKAGASSLRGNLRALSK